jgi:hypothetical protein
MATGPQAPAATRSFVSDVHAGFHRTLLSSTKARIRTNPLSPLPVMRL